VAFTGRTFDSIRDELLAEWAYQHSLVGEELVTTEGSDAWMSAGAFALTLMPGELEAETLQDQILPDRAGEGFLLRHGNVEGIPRLAAVAAVLLVNVTGTVGASSVPTGRAMTAPSGLRFVVISTVIPREGALDGGGGGSVYVRCVTPGTGGNLGVGTTLTWVSPPVGFDPPGTVAGTQTAGEAAETDSAYAQRVMAWRRNRPGSGNNQDWREWGGAVDGVDVTFVFPNVLGNTTGLPGVVTLLALGPAPGSSTAQTRILSGDALANVAAYIEGTQDAHGAAVPSAQQVQRRPTTMLAGNYSIITATPYVVNITLAVTVAAAYRFPFVTGPYTIASATSKSAFTLTPAPNTLPTAQRPVAGNLIAVAADVRGGYALSTIATVNASTGAVTITEPLPAIPGGGEVVLPAPAVWAAILAKVLPVIDGLGPGDTDRPSASPLVASRWPAPEMEYRPTLYRSALQAAALSVPGVIDATVPAPAADVVPDAFRLVLLGTLTLTP